MDVYKVMWDTWRSQVDSYWQRSGYFALFETAAIGGCLATWRRLAFAANGGRYRIVYTWNCIDGGVASQ